MQVPIVQGVYTSGSNYRRSYPVNMMPLPQETGVSAGFLRPSDGLVLKATGPGIDRGGVVWNGVHYRVMGTKLCSVSNMGNIAVLADVGGRGQVTLDYSFDRLAIASGGDLFYWNGTTLTQVTDPDLGNVVDFVWVDGYFMTTDGSYLIVTELSDPTAVNPLKYGSSEIDPDPVLALWKIRAEVYAVNRHSIEVFDNVGADGFPFQRIEGASITRGAVGTHMCCTFVDTMAFVGSGRNEAIGVYIGVNAGSQKISTREIDLVLASYTEEQLSKCITESRLFEGRNLLYIHLPDRTLVYDARASEALQDSIWFVLTSSLSGFSKYRANNFVLAYGEWISGDPTGLTLAKHVDSVSTHYGNDVRWEFGTTILYNEGMGAVFHELELIALPGRVSFGADPQISTSYSVDGETWSQDRFIQSGSIGQRSKRLVWFRQGHMRQMRMQRFQGDSQSHLSVTRLDAKIEPLGV